MGRIWLSRWAIPSPAGIDVDKYGKVYVADQGNNRVQKFDSNGNFITKWGSEGSGDGQFNLPEGIAVDSSGNVYIADTGNNRIEVFSNQNNISKDILPIANTGVNQMVNITNKDNVTVFSKPRAPPKDNLIEKLLNYTNGAIISFNDGKKSITLDNLRIIQQDLINANTMQISDRCYKLDITKLLGYTNEAIKNLVDNKKSVVQNNLVMLQKDLLNVTGKEIVIDSSNSIE